MLFLVGAKYADTMVVDNEDDIETVTLTIRCITIPIAVLVLVCS